MAWYASFGEQILGKLDPQTGKVTEYQIPLLKPDAPTGILGVRFDHDENLWLGMQFQGGIAKFDRKTETFQTWSLPPELNGRHVQINQVSPDRHACRRQGLAAGCRHLHRAAARRRVRHSSRCSSRTRSRVRTSTT